MNYWLLKSDVEDFSISNMQKEVRVEWVGVRNYQARNFMRDQMKLGDLAIFYHSNAEPSGCAGVVRIASQAHPDSTALIKKSKYFEPRATGENPIWFCVDVEFIARFEKLISIGDLRNNPKLADLEILKKGSRLSVTPLSEIHFKEILRMSQSFVKKTKGAAAEPKNLQGAIGDSCAESA